MSDTYIWDGKIVLEVEPDDVHWLVSEWKPDDEATKKVWELWYELTTQANEQ